MQKCKLPTLEFWRWKTCCPIRALRSIRKSQFTINTQDELEYFMRFLHARKAWFDWKSTTKRVKRPKLKFCSFLRTTCTCRRRPLSNWKISKTPFLRRLNQCFFGIHFLNFKLFFIWSRHEEVSVNTELETRYAVGFKAPDEISKKFDADFNFFFK